MLSSSSSVVAESQIKAKTTLINDILEESSQYLKGSQLMELNKTLNRQFEKYEIFVEQNVNLHENYVEENKAIIELFLSNKKLEGLSDRTLDYYEHTIYKCVNWIDKPIPDITSQDIREWLNYVQSIGRTSNNSLDNLRRNLSSFFGTISNEGYIQTNPMAKIKKIKSTKQVKKPFSELEIERMRDELNNKPEDTPLQTFFKTQDQALFELLLSSGIRLQECCQLNKSDIDLQNRTFLVLGKGNKERVCYFSVKCQYFLDKLLNFRYHTGYDIKYTDYPPLFVTKNTKDPEQRLGLSGVERKIRELGKKCDVKAHPHKFRRTFATTLLRKGVPIEQIKDLMGHSNIDTTMIYAIVDQDQVRYNHGKYAG